MSTYYLGADRWVGLFLFFWKCENSFLDLASNLVKNNNNNKVFSGKPLFIFFKLF